LFPAEKERIVKLLVQEVVLRNDGLLIRLRLHGLNSLVAELRGDGPAKSADGRVEPGKDGQTVDVRVPMEFKLRGGRKEIILPAGAEAEPKVRQNRPLVLALARAHRWQRMIESGEVPGMESIAARLGVNRTYVARMLQLTALAPELVQAILAGKEPSGVSLAKLRGGVPVTWDEQRRLWSSG